MMGFRFAITAITSEPEGSGGAFPDFSIMRKVPFKGGGGGFDGLLWGYAGRTLPVETVTGN